MEILRSSQSARKLWVVEARSWIVMINLNVRAMATSVESSDNEEL